MIDPGHFPRLAASLPIIRRADPSAVREFMQKASIAHLTVGKDVFVEGDRADGIALLISGRVRVYKIGPTGREITLYRFGPGESCILTANAILSRQTFPAIASVEQDADAVMIPADVFRDWVRRWDMWRAFVFDLLSQRLAGVLDIIDDVVFQRMDARLARFLLERSRTERLILITHHEIAGELGSSREVISRILEDFAASGLIRSTRGMIEVIDEDGLEARGV